MHNRFEIVYADASVVRGRTAAEFERAPADGVQFVIIQAKDGTIRKHKALDEYEFKGIKKPGSWMDAKGYESLKRKLPTISKLLN